MTLHQGVTMIDPAEDERVVSKANAEAAQLLILTTAGADSQAAFFDAVRRELPLDPPLVGSRSWDALSDSLWGGLDLLEAGVVVILWRGAADFQRAAPTEFGMAVTVLQDVTESLASVESTDGRPKKVCIYAA
jgi:hypothetical protein